MSNKAIDKDYLLRQLILFETDVIARKAIASEEGYLGFRFYNNKFAYKSGNSWIDIELGDGQELGLLVKNGQLCVRYAVEE